MKYGELVTVGLKAYNQRAFIRAALEGVLSQTYRPLEIIISDDGSTDGTFNVLETALSERFVRTANGFAGERGLGITLLRNDHNCGNMGNWLRICEAAHGEWIVKCDGDDVSDPGRVEEIVRRLDGVEGSSRIKVVSCGGVKIDESGHDLEMFRARSARYPLGACMAFHRDCFARFSRPANERIVDDEVFARRALMIGDELLIDKPLVRYRIGSGISSDCSDVRSSELRCIGQFPESLHQCRDDLSSIREDIGEDRYAEWVRNLDREERQQAHSVALRTGKDFLTRLKAYRAVDKAPITTPYRWKLLLYLLPRSLGDLMLSVFTQARYGGMGILWTGVEKLVVYGINFAQGVVLARLLCPEDFGLSAMLCIFIAVGGTLAESGLTAALIVKGYGPRLLDLERRAFRWNVAIACGVYFLLALFAPAVASWYGHPILAPLMWVMAAGMVVNAASVVSTARLWRTRHFDRLAVVNGGGTLAGAALAVTMAYLGCGVWSIAAMGVCQAMIRTILAWVASRRCYAGIRDGEMESPHFSALLGYGLKLTASNVINVGYTESYNLILGKVFCPSTVGLFARSDRWARLPGDITGDMVGRIALPVLTKSKVVGMWKAMRFVRLNAFLLWPCLVVLWVWAEEIVTFVFGEQWSGCASLLRILLIGQFFVPIANVAQNVIRSSGNAGIVLKTDAWKKPIGIAAMFIGICFGVVGLCWAKVFNDLLGALVDYLYAVGISDVNES